MKYSFGEFYQDDASLTSSSEGMKRRRVSIYVKAFSALAVCKIVPAELQPVLQS